jgi:glycosyltransferase involved in cell wall biosynthesis
MTKEKNILLITTQFTDKYISGFTNRFAGLWAYISRNDLEKHFTFLTNDLIWQHFFKGFKKNNVEILAIRNNFSFKFSSRLFYPLYICLLYKKNKCTSVHVSSTVIDVLHLVRVFNFFRIPYCITFPSNSIEMAAHGNDRMQQKWRTILSEAKNVDILNPTNDLKGFPFKKFISPNSFPYFAELNHFSEEFYLNKKRKNTVVFCGSFIAQKNPLFALKAFCLYLTKHIFPEDIQLIFIGKGDQISELKAEITRINGEFQKEMVSFAPYSELPVILSQSKVFLSLQDFDNYPSQALMEAMIFCNSIISIDNGDTSRMVLETNRNFLLKEKNEEALAEAIHSLINKPDLNLMNREFILKYHNPGRFTEYLLDIHENLAL